MNLKRGLFIVWCCLFVGACKENVLPKPKAMLRLEYPAGAEAEFAQNCAYQFNYNTLANIAVSDNCALTLDYPSMKGTIFLTYKSVHNNLETLLRDAQKLSYEHAIKADNIDEKLFINEKEQVYGMFYEVRGDAASQSQFYVTDSLNHFVTGSLYFYAKPNYDSILPAAAYLQKDIRDIMESLRWSRDQ